MKQIARKVTGVVILLRLFLQRRWKSMGVTFLLWAVGVLCVVTLYLTYTQPAGIHVLCECGEKVETRERVDRYLANLMKEVDPTINRTALQASEAWHPSLAVKFLVSQERRGYRCSTTPGLFSVRHSNLYWQEATVAHTTFLLYGAYYDDRDVEEGPLVRVLVMVEAAWPPTPTCHFWYAHDDPVPVATKAIRMDYVQWQERVEGQWMPFLVTCRAGRNLRGIPRVVSLVAYACEPATNALRVLNQGFSAPYTKKGLALCHKFIFNPARDFSKRLVEWVEVARAWGVDEVMVYEGAAHPNVTKVLRYYQKEGYLKVMPWTSPGSQPSIPHLYRTLYDTQRFNLFSNENVPYTDCLLRHIATHKYVAVWDVDEFMLPATHPSLPAMMDAAKARAESLGLHPTSYLARCSYYFDDLTEQPTNDLPEYLYSLRHVTRTVRLTPPAVFTKSIHDTSYALGLHAHFALVNLAGPVDRIHDLYHLYPGHEAHLAHYRSKCQGESQVECETDFRPYLTRDTTMWRHRQAISNAARRVLMKLNLILP